VTKTTLKLPRRNRWKTDNRVEQLGGERVVVKDSSIMAPWYRYLVGIRLLRREYRALKALNGFAHAPGVRGWLSPNALAIEWVQGRSLRELRSSTDLSFVCQELCRCVQEMHARGVAHCDLHASNILILPDGRLKIVDFATAVRRSEVPAWVWEYATYLDWVAVGKFHRLLCPQDFHRRDAPWQRRAPFGYHTMRNFLHKVLRRKGEGNTCKKTGDIT